MSEAGTRHAGTRRSAVRACRALLIAGVVAVTTPVLGQSLVIGFSGAQPDRFRIGAALANRQPVTLGPAEKLTLLEAGGTRELVGPGRFVAGATGPAQASLDRMRDARPRARLAGTRTLDTRGPDTVWSVDVDRGGDVCFLQGVQPSLWRASTTASRTLDLTGLGAAPSRLSFARGVASLDWPADRPIADGDRFMIGAAPDAVALVWHRIPDTTDLAALARALDTAGCTGQLDRLL